MPVIRKKDATFIHSIFLFLTQGFKKGVIIIVTWDL